MPTATTNLLTIDAIVLDENVIDALKAAIAYACSKALVDSSPTCPVGYLGSRSYLEVVKFVTGALMPFGFVPRDELNQRHLVNSQRYGSSVQFILSGAKKKNGGFKVARKGPVTLQMVENAVQCACFPEMADLTNPATYWILYEIDGPNGNLTIYIARPHRLLDNYTFLETTEFRMLPYGDIVGDFDPALEVLPQSTPIAVVVEDKNAVEYFDDSPFAQPESVL